MLDPLTVIAGAKALAKVVTAGVSAWRAFSDASFDESDQHAIAGLLDAAESARRAGSGGSSGPTAPERLQLELVCAAFGDAWRRHWVLGDAITPAMSKALDRALRQAAAALADPPARAAEAEVQVDRSLRGPLAHPAYAELWRAFTQPDDDQPLLLLEGEGKAGFERDVVRAYAEGLGSDRAAPVRAWLESLPAYRSRLLRELVAARRIADVEELRSPLGSLRGSASLRLADADIAGVPLRAIYVEPGTGEVPDPDDPPDDDESAPPAALQAIRSALAARRVAVVTAPFGHGKTCTARMFAAELALEWLTGDGSTVDNPWPLFVQLPDDLRGNSDAKGLLRAAFQRETRAAGVDAAIDDPAFDLHDDQRIVVIVDAADDVDDPEQLLVALDAATSARRRAVVFARPGFLGEGFRPKLAEVRLAPFDAARIERWLAAWSEYTGRSVPDREQLADAGLDELAQVPLLLAMIATADLARRPAPGSRAALLERFVHTLVAADLDPSAPQAAGGDDGSEAVLSALARIAWEQQRRAFEGFPLHRGELDRLVGDPTDGAHVTEAPRAAVRRIASVVRAVHGRAERMFDAGLLGHHALDDYLVARHWSDVLLRRIHGGSDASLQGGRLSDGATELLLERLDEATPADRAAVARWAQATVDDERLDPPGPRLRDDRRGSLRLAALAIGSALLPDGVAFSEAGGLWSILAWCKAVGLDARVVAPNLRAPGADLSEAPLERASLRGAVLTGSNLRGARLRSADLAGARLDLVSAGEANFTGAGLSEADLRRADLWVARFDRADLTGAILAGATLGDASMLCADASHADLSGVEAHELRAEGANFDHADLTEASLEGADLRNATFRGAILVGANLLGARLGGADLTDADLTDADLTDADLRGALVNGAILIDAELEGAWFDEGALARTVQDFVTDGDPDESGDE